MARSYRLNFENAYHHVMNRGVDHCPIFLADHDRYNFIQLLEEMHRHFNVTIHAYCLMGNHYHLLLQTPDANLSNAMQFLNGEYAQLFNYSHGRDGPLFRGRFKSLVVDSENYFLRVSRYIHLNPVAANICTKPEEYEWSSYNAFIRPNKHTTLWIETKATLDRFGNKEPVKAYQLFHLEEKDTELDDFFHKVKRYPILGTEDFTKSIADTYFTPASDSSEISHSSTLKKLITPSLELILDQTLKYHETNHNAITLNGHYISSSTRQIAAYLCKQIGRKQNKEIATALGGISSSAVSKLISRCKQNAAQDPKLMLAIREISKNITSAN